MTDTHGRLAGGDLEKVTVQLKKADWHDHATETMWARPIGKDRFQLQNVPFYAYGVSYDDVVEAVNTGDQNLVRSVVKRGGHSTYRIFVTNDSALKRFQEFWAPIERCGCTVERATERLFGVDVPPEADIHQVYDLLQAGENASVWDFEEAHVGHPLRKTSH
jgi:hypothetical protein